MFTSTYFNYRIEGVHTYDVAYTIVAGWAYLAGSKLLVKLRIDDAVDAIPVHLVGGMWGLISTGLFSNGTLIAAAGIGSDKHVGWFYTWSSNGDFTLLGIQLLAVLWIFGWTSVTMG